MKRWFSSRVIWRHPRAGWSIDEYVFDGFGGVAVFFGETQEDVETAHAFEYLPCFSPANGGVDHFLHVGDIDAVARNGIAIDGDK